MSSFLTIELPRTLGAGPLRIGRHLINIRRIRESVECFGGRFTQEGRRRA